jgi:glycosyltransferase involved in cell wall biosynthesis
MKLLVLDQFSELGGAQQCLLDLLGEMRTRGWEALVGLPGDGALFARVRELGFDTARIECGPYGSGRKSIVDAVRFLWQMPRLKRQLRRFLMRTSADLVYVNGPRLLPAIPSGVPVVFHSHSYIGPGVVRRLAGAWLRRTGAHVIANCEFVAAAWRGYVGADRVSIIYNGVEEERKAPETRPPAAPGRCHIACMGRIAPEKGQMEFVAAARLIHRAMPEARFQIIGAPLFSGSGYERTVHAAAADLPVEFTGWVADTGDALSQIDLLLVPSAGHEATTRVILEAYAAGVPVIAFRSGGIPEVVEHGVTGFLAGSAEEMAARAIELLEDREGFARISTAARECWERRFTLRRYRRELMQSLESIAARGTAPRPSTPEEPRPSESSHIRTA